MAFDCKIILKSFTVDKYSAIICHCRRLIFIVEKWIFALQMLTFLWKSRIFWRIIIC